MNLTERQQFVLDYLAEHTDAAPSASGDNDWTEPERRAFAFQVQDALVAAGLADRNRHAAIGAANTLASLRRRRLVTKGGDGCFIQARWWITPEGAARAGVESPADGSDEEQTRDTRDT